MTDEPNPFQDPAKDLKDDEQHADLNEKTTPGTESVQVRLAHLGGKAPCMADIPRRRDADD